MTAVLSPHTRKIAAEEISNTLGKHHLNHPQAIEILAMAVVSVIVQQPEEQQTIMDLLNVRVAQLMQHTVMHDHHIYEMPSRQH